MELVVIGSVELRELSLRTEGGGSSGCAADWLSPCVSVLLNSPLDSLVPLSYKPFLHLSKRNCFHVLVPALLGLERAFRRVER